MRVYYCAGSDPAVSISDEPEEDNDEQDDDILRAG